MSQIEQLSPRPNIRLWVFNHCIKGITDQIDFFVSSCKQEGYFVTVSRQPCKNSLNVIVEGLCEKRIGIITGFCREARKKIAVIMTEHFDYTGGKLLVHGIQSDYIADGELALRARMLADSKELTKSFLTMGDLPKLQSIGQYLPSIPLKRIPFPKLEFTRTEEREEQGDFRQELVFTGTMTKHRAHVLDAVRSEGLPIYHPGRMLSQKKKDKLNKEAKIVVNIPQNETWRWLSPMRIFAALRMGRATVSLGTADNSMISNCTLQLNPRDENWLKTLRGCCADWRDMYAEAHQSYSEMAATYKKENGFPHELFNDWGNEEGVASTLHASSFWHNQLAGITFKILRW